MTPHSSTEELKINSQQQNITIRNPEFVERESLLTVKFKESKQSRYLLFASWALSFAFNGRVFYENHQAVHDLFCWSFQGILNVIFTWLVMQVIVICVPFGGVYLWKKMSKMVARLSVKWVISFHDKIWLCLYISLQVLFFVLITILKSYYFDWNSGCKTIIVVEQMRLAMKIHAFVRENIRIFSKLQSTLHHATDNVENAILAEKYCSLRCYCYYLIAPTLVYRTNYPQKFRMSVKFILISAFNVGLCILTALCILVYFQDVSRTYFSAKSVGLLAVGSIFLGSLIPGIAIMCCTFFGFLHSWSNMFAELTYFADRQFYSDWWNSGSMGQYLKTWNTLVYNWLYVYIYVDIFSASKSRLLATTCVFLISSVFHEYVICILFNFLYPVLFGMFMGISFALANVKTRISWYKLILFLIVCPGYGVLLTSYFIEHECRRRQIMPSNSEHLMQNDILNYFVPYTFTCVTFSNHVYERNVSTFNGYNTITK